MRDPRQTAIFVAAFLTIYLGMHAYVLLRLTYLLGIQRQPWQYAVIGFLALSFTAATILERTYPSTITKTYYIIAAVWMGIAFLTFSLLVFFEIINLFISVPYAGYVIIGSSIILSIIGLILASSIQLKDITIPVAGLPQDITMVQLSDVHLGTIHGERFLSHIVDRVNKLKPDIVVITGDLFDGSAPVDRKTIAPLDNITAPVYAIIGNHEIYDGLDRVLPVIKSTKTKVLRNEAITYKGLQIIGVDFSENGPLVEEYLVHIPLKKPVMLLYHAPLPLKLLKEYDINLQLAGHTHYGQIWPFTLPVKMLYPAARGLSQNEGHYLYTSPGTGTWGPPMRLGSRSEITLIHLKSI